MSARFSANEVLPGLILGSRPVGENPDEIIARGIARILRCVEPGSSIPDDALAALSRAPSTERAESVFDVSEHGRRASSGLVGECGMIDAESFAITDLLEPGARTLDAFLRAEHLLDDAVAAAVAPTGGEVPKGTTPTAGSPDSGAEPSRSRSVLVHCNAGQSRSASIVLAWLMARAGLTLREGLLLLRASRPSVGPNRGFLRELLDLEAALFQAAPKGDSKKSGRASAEVEDEDWWGAAARARATGTGADAGPAEAASGGAGAATGSSDEPVVGTCIALPSVSLDREMGLRLAGPSGKPVEECEAAYIESNRDLEAALMKLIGM